MKSLKKRIHRSSIFILAVCLFLSTVPPAPGFIAFEHQGLRSHYLLIKKIDKPHWIIGYRYGAGCKPEEKQNSKALEEAITLALEAWLGPLRNLHPTRQITDDFRYVLQKDFTGDRLNDDVEGRLAVDVRITFECREGSSRAGITLGAPPDVYLRRGTKVTLPFTTSLIHELGHAFGLGDVYILPNVKGRASTGGLERTVGTQPSSIMAVLSAAASQPPYIGEDDRRGIIWLYKHFHDGLALDDCFFPDYVYEPDPVGCRPKYLLIFEVKHAQPSKIALELLVDDPTIDINAQDDDGRSALHYAVMRGDRALVDELLSYEDLDVNIRDADGRTAIEAALKRGNTEIVTLLLTVPDIRRPLGSTGQTLTTTWGALKLER